MRLLFPSIALLLVSGCAVTSITRFESITLVNIGDQGEEAPAELGVNCPGKLDSIMMSPIVPLPPIIPVGFDNEESATVVMKTPHEHSVTARVLDAQNRDVEVSIATSIWTGNEYARAPDKSWAFRIGSSCSQLDRLILQLEVVTGAGKITTYRYRMEYTIGAFELNSGYLGS
jgi:hypothetical protein